MTNKYNKRYAKQKGNRMDKASKRENTISDQKRQGIARIIPPYAVIPLLSCLAWNCIVYWGTQLLCANRPHFDFSTPFDLALPFQSWWILIYVSSFVFWPLCYVMTAKYNSKEFLFRFVTADLLSRTICGVFFIVLPTTNARPQFEIDGFCDALLALIYHVDMPYDLFPSIHCLVSLMCWLGIYRCHEVKFEVKAAVLVYALLICASTQFTKQHYIVDVAGGLLTALLAFALGMRTNWYRPVQRMFERVNQRVWRDMGETHER